MTASSFSSVPDSAFSIFAAESADLITFLQTDDGKTKIEALNRILQPLNLNEITLYRTLSSEWESWSLSDTKLIGPSSDSSQRIDEILTALTKDDFYISPHELWIRIEAQPWTLLHLGHRQKAWQENELMLIRQLQQFTAAHRRCLSSHQNEIQFFHEIMDQIRPISGFPTLRLMKYYS